MYYQLGTTKFEGMFGPHELERVTEARYAEIDMIGGKPDLQFTGLSLDIIKLNIRLHERFCNPDLRYSELENYRVNGEILPFVDGYGNILGNFVIEKIKQEVIHTDPKGAVTHCELELSLKEHVDPDRVQSKADKAKRNAFALTSRSLSYQITTPLSNPAADLFKTMRPIGDGANSIGESLKKADENPGLANRYIQQALHTANAVSESANALQSKIDTYNSDIANADAMASTAAQVGSQASLLVEKLKDGDLVNAMSASSVLQSAIGGLNTAAIPLQKSLILR